MYKILISDASLHTQYKSLFPDFNITIANSAEEIINLTYLKQYNMYIINFIFYNTIKELKEAGDQTTTIFIDDYYNIYNLKKTFQIADDYMIQPLILEELQIRVNYHYKKTFQENLSIIRYKDFFYHSRSKQLYLKNQRVKLSPNEVKILELFLSKTTQPLSKNIIFETIESTSDGSLRVYISKLKKLGFKIDYNRYTTSYSLKAE